MLPRVFTPPSARSSGALAGILPPQTILESTAMLLCDFHIHTTYSDGIVPLPKVVDMFGRSGHDVIAITDHIVNRDNGLGRIAHGIRHSLNPETWKRYAEEIDREA